MKKIYLVVVSIIDGEREYSGECLLKASNAAEVDSWFKKHGEEHFLCNPQEQAVKLRGVREITKAQADVVQSLALSFFA